MEKVDRRIQRTQRALMDALVTLSLEKGYDAISIRDITERANVSYSTFFRHYAEKDELLSELLKSVAKTLTTLINHNPNKSKEAEGKLIFQHVADNHAFFRILFSSQGTSRVMRNIQDEIADSIMQSNSFVANDVIPPEIVANQLVIAILGLIRWWLDHDIPYDVERMSMIYSRLIVQGFANILVPEELKL
ncbi:MAG: TetR family transcriptional regulator [Chloroflexi bacterium]|nr:TetR family transcriptional regulator [Chloroflexota bacterium]